MRIAVRRIPEYSGDPVLRQNWVPLLGGASGDIYAAVWDPGEDAKVAGVLIGEPTEIEFMSVDQMVAVFNGCYRARAFFTDEKDRLMMDSRRYDQVYSNIAG